MGTRAQGSGGWLGPVEKSSGEETEPSLKKTSSWPRKVGKGHGLERSTEVDAEQGGLKLGKSWWRGKEVTEGGVGGEKTCCVTLGCPLTNEAHRAEGCSGALRRPADTPSMILERELTAALQAGVGFWQIDCHGSERLRMSVCLWGMG